MKKKFVTDYLHIAAFIKLKCIKRRVPEDATYNVERIQNFSGVWTNV